MAAGLILHALAGIIFSFFLHLIFHELGHMLGGLLTGWKFLYLQIFNIALVREKGWFFFKKIDSINFQCIMRPKSLYSNPYLYNLGGCLANLLLSLIAVIGIFAGAGNIVIPLYGWSAFVMGAGFLIMNGLPRVKSICNDMACHLLIKKEPLTRLCHNLQLMSAGLLYKGMTYKRLGEEMLSLPSDQADNDILAYQAILEYYYFLDRNDYRAMLRALEKIKDKRKLSDSIKGYYNIELVYISLIKHIYQCLQLPLLSKLNNFIGLSKALEIDSFDNIDAIKDCLIRYRKKGDLHFERVKAIFDAYMELAAGRKERAEQRLIKAIDYISNMACIYPGEKEFCIRQLRRLLISIISHRKGWVST